jgi:hypothetical protein
VKYVIFFVFPTSYTVASFSLKFKLLSLLLLSLLLLLALLLLLLLALTTLTTVWREMRTKAANPNVENCEPGGQKFVFLALPSSCTASCDPAHSATVSSNTSIITMSGISDLSDCLHSTEDRDRWCYSYTHSQVTVKHKGVPEIVHNC